MALTKSVPEQRADALVRATRRGRASLRETALILQQSWPTIKAQVDLGRIQAFHFGKRQYVSLEELRNHGASLPHHHLDEGTEDDG